MTLLEQILARLEKSSGSPVVQEIRDGRIVPVTGGELLSMVGTARSFIIERGIKRGERCVILAPNSIAWIATNLALLAEGAIVVPLNTRQTPAELSAMMADCTPAHIFCDDSALIPEIRKIWPAAPPVSLFDSILSTPAAARAASPLRHEDSGAVTIIYTSGTSGEPKGVVLSAANVTFMLGCTNQRLDQLMGANAEPDRIFQYAPFCFAAAWILLLTSLSRNSILSLSTDLTKLADEIKVAAPNYFVNVPMFLERVRGKVEESIRKRSGSAAYVFNGARRSFSAHHGGSRSGVLDSLCHALANAVMFPAIRKSIGPNLKALICGSAPLAVETQLFFVMLGIPVLQVYGLTETTAICTMDDPRHVEPGFVGPAIPGIEMIVADTGEILVRGPNIFPGYWQRPEETARALEGEWFHTGDQGEVNAKGNWRVTGRLKNLIILNSGHNIPPEPLEQKLAAELPSAQHVVLVGNQRSFLAALISIASVNGSYNSQIQSTLDAMNASLPHYKQIRSFRVVPELFTPENGLLTAMGKLKRDAISARFSAEIDEMYRKKTV